MTVLSTLLCVLTDYYDVITNWFAEFKERYESLDSTSPVPKFLYGNPITVHSLFTSWHKRHNVVVVCWFSGSHYSSGGVVLHYLVRQEPFTPLHVELVSIHYDAIVKYVVVILTPFLRHMNTARGPIWLSRSTVLFCYRHIQQLHGGRWLWRFCQLRCAH